MDVIVTIFVGILYGMWILVYGIVKLLLAIMYYQDKKKYGEKKAKSYMMKTKREMRLFKILVERD